METVRQLDSDHFLLGGGEMGALTRAYDWTDALRRVMRVDPTGKTLRPVRLGPGTATASSGREFEAAAKSS